MKFTTALAILAATFGTVLDTRASDLTLDGSAFYQLGSRITYYGGGGPNQSGRYASLGSDYYHKATIGSRWITNHSNSKSGDLSFELWAMRYYGATSGIVLMTRGLNPLYGGSYYSRVERSGHAVFLDRFRFPELDLWEFTRNGWKWRDALTFTKKDLL